MRATSQVDRDSNADAERERPLRIDLFTDSGEPARTTLEVDLDIPALLGRARDCDLSIPDARVSRRHARLLIQDGRLLVEDLESARGTFLNGERVHAATLVSPGDRISLGPLGLRVEFLESSPTASAPSGQATTGIDLDGEEFLLGRDDDCELRLDSLHVSRHHARFFFTPHGWEVEDLDSTNGTHVDGRVISEPTRVEVGSEIRVGPFQLEVRGERLVLVERGTRVKLEAQGLEKSVSTRQGPLKILKGLDLVVHPGEFVGLIGPSGCGKSTLLRCLSGRSATSAGAVRVAGHDLRKEFASLRSILGFVPQAPIFHGSLRLSDALRYASRLRLSRDVTRDEVEVNVRRVIELVGLVGHEHKIIAQLSGGQQKRVSLAMELLGNPAVLFLDEMTSGLDLAAEQEMMQLFRRLADEGTTVLCITHHLESVAACDRLVVLLEGRLVFVGALQAMKEHFRISELADIYRLGAQKDAQAWEAEYRTSSGATSRSHADFDEPADREEDVPRGVGAGPFRQFRILVERYAHLLLGDRRMQMTLTLLPMVLASLVCLLTSSLEVPDEVVTAADLVALREEQGLLGFGAILLTLFLGLFSSVQEILSERAVFAHERSMFLGLLPYLASKVVILCGAGIFQCGAVLAVLVLAGGLDGGPLHHQLGLLVLVNTIGVLVGLGISASVPATKDASNMANLAMIAVVIPQLLFAGALVPVHGNAESFAEVAMTSYWGFQAYMDLIEQQLPVLAGGQTVEGAVTYGQSLTPLGIHGAAALGFLLAIMWIKGARGHGAAG